MSEARDAARAAVLGYINHFPEWDPRLVQDLTGLKRGDACQLLLDLAAEGRLEGAFQRYKPATLSPELRLALGAPPARPYNALTAAAALFTAAGRPMRAVDVERGLIKATSKQGRPGVNACVNLRRWFTLPVWPGLLPYIYRGQPNVAGWQLLLSDAWHLESGVVVEAAGSHGALVKWFRYADFGNVRLPTFRSVISLDVPDEIVLYRGGQGCPRQLALGWSWTTDRTIAASYAGSEFTGGEPVILKRTGNVGALMRRHVGTLEVTIDPLADPAAAVVDTSDAHEIAELRKIGDAHMRTQLRVRTAAISDEQVFDGYYDD